MELNTGVSIQANKLDSATSYVVGLQHCTSKCTAVVSITLTAATIAWLKHRMKHISSLYLSSRKAANSAALLSPYKSCSPLHLWNDAPIFRALQGPYCFSNDHFVVRNDRIFHCLNIPQNSANLEYTSHLPKNVIIYCRPQLPPLGGAIIKESTFQLITHIYCTLLHVQVKNFTIYYCPQFPPLGGTTIKESVIWLITLIYFVAHSETLYPRTHWIVLNFMI